MLEVLLSRLAGNAIRLCPTTVGETTQRRVGLEVVNGGVTRVGAGGRDEVNAAAATNFIREVLLIAGARDAIGLRSTAVGEVALRRVLRKVVNGSVLERWAHRLSALPAAPAAAAFTCTGCATAARAAAPTEFPAATGRGPAGGQKEGKCENWKTLKQAHDGNSLVETPYPRVMPAELSPTNSQKLRSWL